MVGPYCNTCGGGCPSTGCLKAPFIWGFDGCFLRARLNGIDVKPLDLCKWLYCNETDTKMQLVPNGDDSYIEFFSERDINGCENAPETETDKIYVCDLLGLASIDCLRDVMVEDPQRCDIMVYSPGGVSDDCPGCDEHKKDKWTNYTIPQVNLNLGSDQIVAVNADGCLVKGPAGPLGPGCGSQVKSYVKNAYSGIWYTNASTGSYSNRQYGPVMGMPSYTNNSDCTMFVRLDAREFACSTAVGGGPYNFAIGLSAVSSRADVTGKTEVITWDHLVSSAGTNYGSYQRLTLNTSLYQIVKLNPGQSVTWTVRTFRANFGSTQIMNDDGTTAGDMNAERWTMQAWRAEG